MRITRKAMNYIHSNIGGLPPETGGILGSRDGNIITHVVMDKQEDETQYMCCYSPNIEFLNFCVEGWQQEDILFKGIFHTHFAGVRSLSFADREYITNIMNAMPTEIKDLYFPIYVLPNRELVVYRASRRNTEIYIEKDFLEAI